MTGASDVGDHMEDAKGLVQAVRLSGRTLDSNDMLRDAIEGLANGLEEHLEAMEKARSHAKPAARAPAIGNEKAEIYKIVGDMEDPLLELENRAKIMFGVTGEMDDDDGMIVYQLARDVRAATKTLSAIHGRLFKMTHPNPAKVAEVEAEAAQRVEEAMPNRDGKTG